MQPEMEIIINAYVLRSETVIALEKKVSQQDAKIAQLEAENARLKELVGLQQQRQFGKKSEAALTPFDTPKPNETLTAHTRKKKAGRLLQTTHLPRYQQWYDLAAHEQHCDSCHGALQLMGKTCTERLEIIPSRYCVVEHIQMKYTCRQCETVKTAPKPLAPIPKGIAGASVLTDIIVNKYQFCQPLYRQSKIMRSEGIHLPDNTLGNGMITLGFALEKVYEAMWEILNARYLQVDETPVKLLAPDKTGYLWTYYAPHVGDNKGIVVFELSETRSAAVAKARLQSFNGLLQTDGYAGYHSLRQRVGIVGLGCFTHARRRFSEIVKMTPGNGIAAQMLERMKPLYALEARMREAKLCFHTRKRLRQRIARPQTQAIHCWLREVQASVPPKSQLGQAIEYTLKQWPYLVAYLRHGAAEIDTNQVENKIRDIALGKKNWLFIGNKDSGKIHAIFYSLVLSCQLNDINPRVYIHYLLTKIHDLRCNKIDPHTLLPHTIDCHHLQTFINEQITFAKKMLHEAS